MSPEGARIWKPSLAGVLTEGHEIVSDDYVDRAPHHRHHVLQTCTGLEVFGIRGLRRRNLGITLLVVAARLQGPICRQRVALLFRRLPRGGR